MQTNQYVWYFDKHNATTMGLYLTKVEGQFIENAFSQYGFPKNLLDVGGGSGRFAIPLYRRGINVVVLDIEALPLQILHEKENKIKSIIADAKYYLPFKNSSFDCILCIELPIIRKSMRYRFFEECYRILNGKGLLVFTSTNTNSYKGFIKNIMKIKGKWRYFSNYSETIKELHAVGFTLKSAQGFHWVPGFRRSDHKLIHIFAFLEKIGNLNRLPRISPWVFFTMEKI